MLILGIETSCDETAAAVVRGTFAAGGSDSSCYALMAEAFARGLFGSV